MTSSATEASKAATYATAPATINDYVRQSLFLIFSVLMPLSTNLPQITGFGRTISEQSDSSDTLLVPWGPAFSIWIVIFAGLFLFAIIQALPGNRTRAIFRDSGWWITAAFALTAAWSVAASYPPVETSRWLTVAIFTPLVALACQAMVILSRRDAELSRIEQIVALGSVALYAGWCSLAIFLNWNQVFTADEFSLGLPETFSSIAMLSAALLWVGWNLRRSRGNAAYAFPVVWGLAFLAYARFAVDDLSWVIGGAALIGIAAVIASTARVKKTS